MRCPGASPGSQDGLSRHVSFDSFIITSAAADILFDPTSTPRTSLVFAARRLGGSAERTTSPYDIRSLPERPT